MSFRWKYDTTKTYPINKYTNIQDTQRSQEMLEIEKKFAYVQKKIYIYKYTFSLLHFLTEIVFFLMKNSGI